MIQTYLQNRNRFTENKRMVTIGEVEVGKRDKSEI